MLFWHYRASSSSNLVFFARKLAPNTIFYNLHVKLLFYGFLSFFCTFVHNVAQTWFVFHETLHTTLFGIYYFVEVIKIENHSNMLEITC